MKPLPRYIALFGAAIARGTLTHQDAFHLLTCAFPDAPEDDIDAGLLDAVATCERIDLHELRHTLAASVK